MTRARKIRRTVLAVLLPFVLVPSAFIGWRWSGGNQGVVVPGQVYRSSQLGPSQLREVFRDRGIRTVLNLRGPNASQDWYNDELKTTLEQGATQIDIPLASDHWLSRDQARTLVQVLDTADRPLLIHCQFGAERTGLVTAFEELLRLGGSLESARAQFSVYYLFLPVQDGAVMIGHLHAYESWLSSTGRTHSPDAFRRWLTSEYVPPSPSREQWPYDPYPLRVVTSPSPLAR